MDDTLCQRIPRRLCGLDYGPALSLCTFVWRLSDPWCPRHGLLGFNVFALVVTLVPFKRHERWAWYALWMLPLQWLAQFVFFPDLAYLTLALLTTVGLILPYRRFFPREQPIRVE